MKVSFINRGSHVLRFLGVLSEPIAFVIRRNLALKKVTLSSPTSLIAYHFRRGG